MKKALRGAVLVGLSLVAFLPYFWPEGGEKACTETSCLSNFYCDF
jgi:hypothetical protein